jgi:dTDP-glucose 4,6-dehydratase
MANRSRNHIVVTGGCGFIGSNLIRYLLRERADWKIVNVDLLTYAGNRSNLSDVTDDPRYLFVQGDIADRQQMDVVFRSFTPFAVINCAAETHVDRSLQDSSDFVRTNVLGTQVLLHLARLYGSRLVQVSSDEVYGSLGSHARFREDLALQPRSPYSASKAAADMLILAALHSFSQDVVITRCSNNYGPYQHVEKLIPLMITNALEFLPLPVYGEGKNVRDWIHVSDHCKGIVAALERGRSGRIYNFGGGSERTNIAVVRLILSILGRPNSLIRFVADRPGHDFRYAMDFSRAEAELSWAPAIRFRNGLEETIEWYVKHESWWKPIKKGSFRRYYEMQYAARLEGA